MLKPKICVTIIENNLPAIKEIEPDVDFFEVRLDLIGQDWTQMVKLLNKPWIACNRSQEEGGQGNPDPLKRIEELFWAAETGASIVDIEYQTRGLEDIIRMIKARAQCLVSYHDMAGTPSYDKLVGIARSQIKAGADICKIVTTAHNFVDNLTILKLINRFPETRMVAFGMSEVGRPSRILSPLIGGYFTYACAAPGQEAASGQIPVKELREIYSYLKRE